MIQPLISVVVPVYNSENYLNSCIDSILSQTHKNIELLLIDNGSTDHSISIIQKYLIENPNRIKFESIIGGGPGRPRNIGIEKAQGEYIFFCDSDDIMAPDSLERYLQVAEKELSEIVIGNILPFFDTFGIRLYRNQFEYLHQGSRLNHNMFSLIQFHYPHIRFYQTKFLKENEIYFPEGLAYEDLYHSCIANFLAKKISFIANKEKPLYFYRRGIQSITSKIVSRKRYKDNIKIYEISLNYFNKTNNKEWISFIHLKNIFNTLIASITYLDFKDKESLEYLFQNTIMLFSDYSLEENVMNLFLHETIQFPYPFELFLNTIYERNFSLHLKYLKSYSLGLLPISFYDAKFGVNRRISLLSIPQGIKNLLSRSIY